MNSYNERVGRPASEGQVRISKLPRDLEDELGMHKIWERVRPTVTRNELPPQILLTFICSSAGKASASLAEGQVGAAKTHIEEMVTIGLRALAQLEKSDS
jgi:hypothetical protein